jgi:hypothetical protein
MRVVWDGTGPAHAHMIPWLVLPIFGFGGFVLFVISVYNPAFLV